MFSSYKDDPSCFNSQPLLENRGQPPFLPASTSKQTSGPPWDYSQQTFSAVPFYSGDQNLNNRHPGIHNVNTVPHMENSSLLSNVISGNNSHQSVVRPRAVINCQTNCEACYSHSFTRFPQSWSAAPSNCVRYGGGSSITSLPSDDIPRFPANFPQTDDCSNRFGGDFPSSLNKLSRFSKDAQGITASIPKKNISPVTDGNILIQQKHSRGMGISEQYASSLAVDDSVGKTEVCHIACRGMCGQSNCKIYKHSSMKCANLNSVPAQQYGMPRENVVRYTGHAAGVTGGSQWPTENHQPSRLWLPKGHPPGIWIPPQDPVNSFEHSGAASFWGERNNCDVPSQQFQSQNYETSLSFKSANQIRTVQSISYKESMGGVHEQRTEKIQERTPVHQNAADTSRYSVEAMKRRQEDLSTSEHAARYMEAPQRNQQRCDNTGTPLSHDLHYQKLTARNAYLPSKSYPETEVNKERCRDSTASTDLLLQNATKALLNSNETIQNYTPPLDPHNDISRKYSFSAPVGNYPTYQNDGKFHSPVLGIAQPPSRFGSHVTYTNSKISRNSNGIFPDTYVEGSRPLSCQLPSDNDSFLNQHISYDSTREYAGNLIHCSVQNPDTIIRCGSVKDTSDAITPQMTVGLQSCNKITNPNVTGYFGTSANMHEIDNNSKSGDANPVVYNRDSVVTNSFQDNAHSVLYQSSSSTFVPNAFINELNYPSKRYTNVPVISRSDKQTSQISTTYDTSYTQNSPLAPEGSPDRPIKKRKSRVRNMDNMEKQMDNGRNNHVLDVRQFLETWDEEMDLSPAPRLPDVVLSSNSAENPLLVLDCRQLGTNGVATLSAVDRSTGNLIQTYQQPVESPSENNELSKHTEQQFGDCTGLLSVNPLEEISKLCNANQTSDTEINKQDTPDSEIAPQQIPLSNSVATEFSLNGEGNGVDTCSVSDGVIQELLLPSQQFQNTKSVEKTDISDFNPLHDCDLNTDQTSSSVRHSPHRTLQVSENERADTRVTCKNGNHISDSYFSDHKQGMTVLGTCQTSSIPKVQNSASEATEGTLKSSRIQTLKQLCEYVLQQCGTSKHCIENGNKVVNQSNITTCEVPLPISDCKPKEKLSNTPDAVETSVNLISVQDTGNVHHKQTTELSYLLNDSPNDKEAFKIDAHSEEDDILDNNKVDLDHNKCPKHSDAEKQTCLLQANTNVTVKSLEDKSFKQSAEEKNERTVKDELKEGNAVAEESCELRFNIANTPNKISSDITPEVSRSKSSNKHSSQNSDTCVKGDNLFSNDGDLKSILTNKEDEFKTALNKNLSHEPCFSIDAVEAVDFSQPTFDFVKEESGVHKFPNRAEKLDNCESILISTMRNNISSVLTNSGSESDDRYDLDMSVTSSIHSDLDFEQSQPRKTQGVEITYDDSNEFFDSDVMEADELMHSNMTEASDDIISCSSAFETSYCKTDDTKEHEKNEAKTNQYKDDFSLLGNTLMQPKLELSKCRDQTSEVILPDKFISGRLAEESTENKEELQTEKESISKWQQSGFGFLDENLNVNRDTVLYTLKQKILKSNGESATCTPTNKMARLRLIEDPVEESKLDKNQNQSLSPKLKIAATVDNADEVLQKLDKVIDTSAENVHIHSKSPEESIIVANDYGLLSKIITKHSAKLNDCAEISNLFDTSTKVHEPSQKSGRPASEPLEIEHVHLEGNELSNTVTTETKDCSELANFSDTSTEEEPVQEPFHLLVDPLEDVHADFKCTEASTMVANIYDVTGNTKSKHKAKDYTVLPDTSTKEDDFFQKSNKSFEALENVHNIECSEVSSITANDCNLPSTIITKSKLKTKDYTNKYNGTDNELAPNYDSEVRQNETTIVGLGNSSLAAEYSCDLESGCCLIKNPVNTKCEQNTMNINPPDLLHNVLVGSRDESEQKDASNIQKVLRNEKAHVGNTKNILEASVSESYSKKIIIENVFPRASVNLCAGVIEHADVCCNSDNNDSTSLLMNKDTNQEQEQNKFKSKSEHIVQTNEKQLQAFKMMNNFRLPHSGSESNSQFQNSSIYFWNNHLDDLEASNNCEVKSVICKKIDTKVSGGCPCFSSSEERDLSNACLKGKGHVAPSRIEAKKPSENEIIVKNVVGSAFQKFSSFAFANEKFHPETTRVNKKEGKEEAISVYRNIGRSENAIEVIGKLRHASKFLSKCEINVENNHCHALLESYASLKKLSIAKVNNINNIITESRNVPLKITYFLQRQFLEPLIRNYGPEIRNIMKLRTCVSVTDLNCVHLADTLAEILSRNELQIIIELSTYSTRNRITNNAIIEACRAYSHCRNKQPSGYHCIEYLDTARETPMLKNKNALKRKISQCVSNDEVYHSFSETHSKIQRKINIDGNSFDGDDKFSTSLIIEARLANNHINRRLMPCEPLSVLSATRDIKNVPVSLNFIDNKTSLVITEEDPSKLNTSTLQSKICIESKEMDCKKTSDFQNNNLQYNLRVGVTSAELGLRTTNSNEKPKKKKILKKIGKSHGCILKPNSLRNTTSFVGLYTNLGSKCPNFQIAHSLKDESRMQRAEKRCSVSINELQEVEANKGTLEVEPEDSVMKGSALCTNLCKAAFSSDITNEMQSNDSLDKQINKSSLADSTAVCVNHVEESVNIYSIFRMPINKKMKDQKNNESVRDFLTASNHQQRGNNEGIQNCDSDDRCIPMSGGTFVAALMQGNVIIKGNDENDQKKQNSCIEEFQEDNVVEKVYAAQKIQDAMAEKINDDVVERILDNALVEKVPDDLLKSMQDDRNQNRNSCECMVKSMEESELKQLQRKEESNLFENCHTLVKFSQCQRNDCTYIQEEINGSLAKQGIEDNNYMHLRATQNAEKEIIMATSQKQEMVIKRIAVKKNIIMKGKEIVDNNANEIFLSHSIQKIDEETDDIINSNVIKDKMTVSKAVTSSDIEMRDIRESRGCDKVLKATENDVSSLPVLKITNNTCALRPLSDNVYAQTEVSNKNKEGIQVALHSLCGLHGISDTHSNRASDEPLVNDNHVKAIDDSCYMIAMQNVTVQEGVLNNEKKSKIEISSFRFNATVTDESALIINPKSKICGNLESHQLYINKASDMSTGSTMEERGTRGKRLELLPLVREKNLILRNIGSTVKELQHTSKMQKAEEPKEGREDINTRIETTLVLKVQHFSETPKIVDISTEIETTPVLEVELISEMQKMEQPMEGTEDITASIETTPVLKEQHISEMPNTEHETTERETTPILEAQHISEIQKAEQPMEQRKDISTRIETTPVLKLQHSSETPKTENVNAGIETTPVLEAQHILEMQKAVQPMKETECISTGIETTPLLKLQHILEMQKTEEPMEGTEDISTETETTSVLKVQHISEMQKVEEPIERTDGINTGIETTPVLKLGTQSLLLMSGDSHNNKEMVNETNNLEEEVTKNSMFLNSGSISGTLSVAPKANILGNGSCSYNSKHTTGYTNNLLVSSTIQNVKSLKDTRKNLKKTNDKTEDAGSKQEAKCENETGLSAKQLKFCDTLQQSTDLTANVADQEIEKSKLNSTIENKSSLCRLESLDMQNGIGITSFKVNISLNVPGSFDLVKENQITEERVFENNSMENSHDVDAYVDMPHLEAISTEISSNDSEAEMPCLELIHDLQPAEIDHVQELGERSENNEGAEVLSAAVEESAECARQTQQQEPSVYANISVNANMETLPTSKICIEEQRTLEETNDFQQENLEARPAFSNNTSTVLEAEGPVDYSVQKSLLPVGNQNAHSTCESSLKSCYADPDGWDGVGFTENYSPQSDNSEEIVGKEMHFSDKEKFCTETEPPKTFPICTESVSIPLQILESETEYIHCMNDELNNKECWTSDKIISDNTYIAGEEASDFNPSSQVCSDVLMSNCEPELNIQERLELDIPSLVDSVPSQLVPPEIGSSLGDVIPADFVTNWPYLEEEVLCEADNTLCYADTEYQPVHSSSPAEQCLPSDVYGTGNTSALDLNPSSLHTDSATVGEFKCRLSWKKIFNFSKLDKKQRKKYKKVEKEDESMVASVSSTYDISDTQNKSTERGNCMPVKYHTSTSELTSNNKEVDGLELGPAKIEVRIPRSANTKGLPKVWKVVDRSKPLNMKESQKENTEVNGGNLDDIGQVPIVVVKRLILKRGCDDEDADKAKRRKHSHKKTIKHLSGKCADVHGLLKHVNMLQVNDIIHKSAYSSATHVTKEFNEKPTGCGTDDTIGKRNDLRDTNENNYHCKDSSIKSCSTTIPSSAEGVHIRNMISEDPRIADNGSENDTNNENSSVSPCDENNFSNPNTDISECTEQQKVSQKIPKVIIKRTVGIDNTNNYRSFLTDGVLSDHSRSSWNPVVKLERNASLDSLAKKLLCKEKATETFAQSQVRHGIKINLRSPPGTPAVTIVSLSSTIPTNTDNTNHSYSRRKHLYSGKKRGSTLEECNSSVSSNVLNSSSENLAQLSSSCPSDGWESHQETTENQTSLNHNVTRIHLNNTNNLEAYAVVENKDCTGKDFTKITFHRHKKKRRKTESNKRKKKSHLNCDYSANGTIKQTFLNIKNGVPKGHCQLTNALDSSGNEGDNNSDSVSEQALSEEIEHTPDIFLASKSVNIEMNESQSTNLGGCIIGTSKGYDIRELGDNLTSPDFTLENKNQKLSFMKNRKRCIEEEYMTDELPLFHPDRILTYSCSSKNKKLKFKDKSHPPDEQELEKEIKDLCLEMASPNPSSISRTMEETNTSVRDASEHGSVTPDVCKSSGSMAGLKMHNCPEMMCCQVNGHLYDQHEERILHINQHPFHCQRCHLGFQSEDDFINHLAEQHPRTRAKHHCLLCERTFPSAERHRLHLAGRTHRHLEVVQRRTIHALFSLFTGHSCPVLEPLTESELAGLNWLPAEPGTLHFYHQSTPLQRVIQKLMCRRERNHANVAPATTQRFSPTVPVEEDSITSEHQVT